MSSQQFNFESPKHYQKIKCFINENSKERFLEAKYKSTDFYAEKEVSNFCCSPDVVKTMSSHQEGSTDAKTNSGCLSYKKKDCTNDCTAKISTFDVGSDSIDKSYGKNNENKSANDTEAAIKAVVFQ